MPDRLDQQCINTLRFLSVDMVQKANSGHPGLPLGAAPMAYVLWTRWLKHQSAQSALVRSRSLRALGRTRLGAALQPAAPDRLRPFAGRHQAVPPMGQQDAGASRARPHAGRGNHHRAARAGTSAMRSAWRSPRRSSPRATTVPVTRVIDHHTYAIVSDGDLMEGVASEAASLAGHLQARQADLPLRRQPRHPVGRHRHHLFRGSRAALRGLRLAHRVGRRTATTSPRSTPRCDAARAETARPSLILVRTHIGYGSPEQDSFKAHGSPLGVDDVRKTKQNLGWPAEPAS